MVVVASPVIVIDGAVPLLYLVHIGFDEVSNLRLRTEDEAALRRYDRRTRNRVDSTLRQERRTRHTSSVDSGAAFSRFGPQHEWEHRSGQNDTRRSLDCGDTLVDEGTEVKTEAGGPLRADLILGADELLHAQGWGYPSSVGGRRTRRYVPQQSRSRMAFAACSTLWMRWLLREVGCEKSRY